MVFKKEKAEAKNIEVVGSVNCYTTYIHSCCILSD